MEIIPTLQQAKEKLTSLIDVNNLRNESVKVAIGTLTAEQAIGKPSRNDYALLSGKEVMIEAQFKGSYGQAFTNQPEQFDGLLNDLLNLNLDTINNRAIFVATLNAVCSHLGIIGKVRHCRNEEPEECGKELANNLYTRFGIIKIAMVGFQPALLENLIKKFGAENIRCSDLDVKNIGTNKFGTVIRDGSQENQNLIEWCDLLLPTGSTLVNNTFDDLYQQTVSRNKHFMMFGVTGAGVAALLGLNIICPRAC
ncbi:MAG: DUF364 domain-containing protein [Dehalococcoidales bacterium]|nr:DUF364 domain-containing protein [Dehalococcoidales bacterium]